MWKLVVFTLNFLSVAIKVGNSNADTDCRLDGILLVSLLGSLLLQEINRERVEHH